MKLPIATPFFPMEAKNVPEVPAGPDWQYEPKWDGFRCLAFRDGNEVELQSKAGQPLTRYFSELAEALRKLKATRFVLDGEIVIFVQGRLSFDDLLQRIHPAESRVARLSKETPAQFVLFDLLVDTQGRARMDDPLERRRALLEDFEERYLKPGSPFSISPATRDLRTAKSWLKTMRGQLDGLVAKNVTLPYVSGERVMQKVKNLRTADCVVGGFRYLAKQRQVGSLLLGLYDEDGLLHHVGFTSSFANEPRLALTRKLQDLIQPPGFTGRAPGGPSRWASEKSSEWEPLKPELVVEVRYDHFSGQRFRHGTKFLRWRPDKAPSQCLLRQVQYEAKSPLGLLRETA